MAFYGITFEPKTIEPITFVAITEYEAKARFDMECDKAYQATRAALFRKDQKSWSPIATMERKRIRFHSNDNYKV